jgi:hypothetical protein
MEFSCPHCNRQFSADDGLSGQIVECSRCQGAIQLPDWIPPTPMPVDPAASSLVTISPLVEAGLVEESPLRFVTITYDGQVSASYRNKAEAKLAIKELRLAKRELQLSKRELNQQQRAIRGQYTDEVRRRASLVRGGGGVGRFIRAVQTTSRIARRQQFADDIAPLERQKAQIDAMVAAIDQVILKVDVYIHSR